MEDDNPETRVLISKFDARHFVLNRRLLLLPHQCDA